MRHLPAIPLSARRVVVAGVGVALSLMLMPATVWAAKPKTWDVTRDFAAHKLINPVPDKYKNPAVWSWLYGEADTPGSYRLMETFFPHATIKKECGVRGFSEWNSTSNFFGLPVVLFNAGPTVERGTTPCALSAEYPAKTFFMHPDNASSLASVVGWKSPVNGVVTVSGSVRPTDSNVEGIVWQLDQGEAVLLGPSEITDTSETTFGPLAVAVTAGQVLYFGMSPGTSGGSYDTTAVTLHIVS